MILTNVVQKSGVNFRLQREKKINLQDALKEKKLESVILSTCNRTEVFVAGTIHLEDLRIIEEYFLSKLSNNAEDKLLVRVDKSAIEHLLRLSCGFKSMVFGEDQILHQLKEAYTFSLEKGYTDTLLNHILQYVISFAKDVKQKYSISEHPLSVSYSAVSQIKKVMDDTKKKILLVGVGNMGKLTLKYLLEMDPEVVYVTNRTHNRLFISLPDDPRLELFDYYEREHYIDKVDLIVSATASPHKIFKKEMFRKREKPLYILDLAIPRDVDPRVDEFDHILRYDMDHIDALIRENMDERKNAAKAVDGPLREKRDELYYWMLTKDIGQRFQSVQDLSIRLRESISNEMQQEHLIDKNQRERFEVVLSSVLRSELEKPLAKEKEGLIRMVKKYGL